MKLKGANNVKNLTVLAVVEELDKERLEIFVERKNSLRELKSILNPVTQRVMIDEITMDLLQVQEKINNWWEDIINGYGLIVNKSDSLSIDFNTREVMLINSKQ